MLFELVSPPGRDFTGNAAVCPRAVLQLISPWAIKAKLIHYKFNIFRRDSQVYALNLCKCKEKL